MTNVELAWDVCLEIGFYKLQYVNYYAKDRRISRDAFFSIDIYKCMFVLNNTCEVYWRR